MNLHQNKEGKKLIYCTLGITRSEMQFSISWFLLGTFITCLMCLRLECFEYNFGMIIRRFRQQPCGLNLIVITYEKKISTKVKLNMKKMVVRNILKFSYMLFINFD